MTTWLLDTSVLIDALNGVASVRQRLNQVATDDRLLASVLVLAELLYGVECSTRKEDNLRRLREELALFEVVPVTEGAAVHFARVKAGLRRQGVTVGDVDLLLAATALDFGATLVTHDSDLLDHPIAGLRVERWAAVTGSAK